MSVLLNDNLLVEPLVGNSCFYLYSDPLNFHRFIHFNLPSTIFKSTSDWISFHGPGDFLRVHVYQTILEFNVYQTEDLIDVSRFPKMIFSAY